MQGRGQPGRGDQESSNRDLSWNFLSSDLTTSCNEPAAKADAERSEDAGWMIPNLESFLYINSALSFEVHVWKCILTVNCCQCAFQFLQSEPMHWGLSGQGAELEIGSGTACVCTRSTSRITSSCSTHLTSNSLQLFHITLVWRTDPRIDRCFADLSAFIHLANSMKCGMAFNRPT